MPGGAHHEAQRHITGVHTPCESLRRALDLCLFLAAVGQQLDEPPTAELSERPKTHSVDRVGSGPREGAQHLIWDFPRPNRRIKSAPSDPDAIGERRETE